MSAPLSALLRHVVAASPQPVADLDGWWALHRSTVAPWQSPLHAAVAAGAVMPSPAWAFASGYQCALRALLPSLPVDHRSALCATEEGGGHPRAIATTLRRDGDGYLLRGSKRFVTLGTCADTLLVVATEGDGPDGRPRLKLVSVPRDAPGVSLTEMPALPVAAEIPHATLSLDGARVSPEAVLDGDGYTRFLKPFRTVEDLHVVGAITGWLAARGRVERWPEALVEELLGCVAQSAALASVAPDDPAGHLALASLLRRTGEVISRAEGLPDTVTALLSIAGRAREARRAAAWKALAPR